jgi:hypothetical protein
MGNGARTAETDTTEKILKDGRKNGGDGTRKNGRRTEPNRIELRNLIAQETYVYMYVYITCVIGSSRWLGGNRDLTETKAESLS